MNLALTPARALLPGRLTSPKNASNSSRINSSKKRVHNSFRINSSKNTALKTLWNQQLQKTPEGRCPAVNHAPDEGAYPHCPEPTRREQSRKCGRVEGPLWASGEDSW